MPQYLPLPDGRSLTVREGESAAQAWGRAQKDYPEAFGLEPEKPAGPGPQSGFVPSVKAGFSNLKGDIAAVAGRSGLMDIADAEKYRAEQEEYQKKTFKPTATFGEAPFTKFKELLGGSLPYMAAPLAAGVGAAALPLSAPVGAAVGMGLAGLASAGQFTGSGLSRQVQEGTPLAQTSLGSAVAAAIPSAALDMVSFKMMPGIRQIFAAAGKEVPEAVAKKIAEQGLKDTLKDYGVATLKTMGVEGLTETGQQVLERMQAGLNLTDAKARDEYFDSFIGGAVLGGAIAPIGRRFERGSEASAQDKEAKAIKRVELAEQQKLAAETATKEEAFKQSPEYALKVADDYAAAEKVKAALLAQKREIVKGSPTETADKAFNKTLYDQMQAQAPELNALGAEYARLEPVIAQAKEQKRVATLSPEEYSLEQIQTDLANAPPARTREERAAALNTPIEKEEAPATPEAIYAAERIELAKEQMGITADVNDYVDYLLTNPRMAQAVVDNQTPLPGLARKEQNAVRSALKLQLRAALKENNRTYEPQGYTQEEQTFATDQPYDDYLSDQETLDRMRQEGFTEQDIARMEKQARMGVVGGESAAVSEQGLLFGEKTVGGIQSGEERAAPTVSRAELRADIQIARETGNKAAANRAQKQLDDLAPGEKGEDKFAGTTAQIQGDVARARQPVRVSQQQDAADARAQAYADMVSIVSKYNKGLAKAAELETARAAVVDNLITDIEATRGVAVSEEEARAIRAQANQLLYDLVSRFGDTRNLSQKDRDLFLPAQNKDGSFSTAPVKGMGIPTVESRAPGRQTFAKQYAASQSIKEGLNALKNKALATDRTTVERKLSLAQDTEQALRAELDRAFARGDIPADQRRILEAVGDNLKVVSGNPESRSIAAAYAARINARVTPSVELTADIKALLAQVEAAKRSETQIEKRERFFGGGTKVTTAQQQELFASDKEMQGYVFDTPAAFDKWLASDALQQMRSSVGLGMPTISRLLQRLAPFQKRADAFRTQADALTTRIEKLAAEYQALQDRKIADSILLKEMSAAERNARLTQVSLAQEMLRQAETNLKAVRDKMDAELSSYQQEFIQAETAFNFSVQVSEDITKAIAVNTTAFQKGEMDAIRKVLDAKKEIKTLLNNLKSDLFPGGADKTAGRNFATVFSDFTKDKKVVAAQQKIVDATRQWRASFALNQTQSRIVAFLDKDLGFQMQLQEEANQLDALAQRMLNAKLTLDLAFKQQQRSRIKQAELQSAGQDVLAARDLVSEAENSLAELNKTEADLIESLGITRTRQEEGRIVEVMEASTELEKSLVAEMNAAGRERDAQLAEAERLTPKMPAQTRRGQAREETQADREARDNKERNAEQAQVEALQALPAERVSFEKRRKLLDVANAVPERVLELDAVIDGADEMVINTQERADRIQAAIAELDKQIDVSAKKVFGKGKTFKDKLEQQSEKIILDRLREERAALIAAAPRVEEEIAQINAEKKDFEGKKAALLERAAEIEEQFSNDVQYNEANEPIPNPVTATILARIPKVKSLIDKNNAKLQSDKKQSKKTRDSRVAAVRKYERELKTLETKRDTKRGIAREATTNTQLVEEDKVRTLDAVRDELEILALSLGQETDAYKALAEQYKNKNVDSVQAARLLSAAALKFGKATPEYKKALKAELNENPQANTVAAAETERLPARKVGPVVRKIGVGQGKVLQAGQVRPITGLQAQRSANVVSLDALRKKVDAAQETAKQAALAIGKAKAADSDAALQRSDAADNALYAAELELQTAIENSKTGPQRRKEAAEEQTAFAAELAGEPKSAPIKNNDTIAAEGFETVFRTSTRGGPTLATKAVSDIVERITANWKNAPEIVVVATENELPLRILGQLVKREATKNTPGLFDIPSGKVYLIASNLRSVNDVVLTVAHEATGHYGLRNLLGGDYTRTMDSLYTGNPAVRKQADAKMEKDAALTQQIAVEEVLADMAETGGTTPAEKSALRRIYDVLRNWFRTTFKLPNVTDTEVQQLVTNARKQVIEGGVTAEGKAPEGGVLRRTGTAQYTEDNALTDLANKTVASPKTFKERLGNNVALEVEMNTVDMRAALREALQRGANAMGDDKLFTQAMYNIRKADQYMPMVQTSMTSGPIEMFTDEKGIKGWRSTNKNSAGDVYAAIADIPNGNARAKMNIATVYMIAQRATNKGLAKLDLGALSITQEEVAAAMAAANADPKLKSALEAVRTAYNAYNAGLINSLATSGAIPKTLAATLLKDGDYVPFYRVNENGMADLVFSDEVTINIGDIRHQPYLAKLKGGETKIMPLDESLPRNTLLLTQKMLTNTATKSIAYAMQSFGEGKGALDKAGKPTNAMPIHSGSAPAGNDIITFNQEPDANNPKDSGQRWLRIKTAGTAMEGIPAELVVKSLEGAHLTLPAFLEIGGIASDLLRAGVTRMPMYLARQLIRDPMAASFTGGLNYGPLRAVAKAGKEFIAMSRGTSETGAKLLEKGLIQSGIFTGDASDLSKMALQLASGKDQSFFDKLFATLDRAAMRADATTRAQVYDNAIANGLSENEADLMTMESMNFYKRGLSPTVQYATRLIPFFNAQIQGLNVLYKAARGQMPFEEQQNIQRKFFNNAMLLVGTGLVYAMAMEDDNYYKNAKPKDKYSNFFLPIPGIKEPFKLPIPYEAGWFFSLAVAAVDAMKAETDGKQQWQALRDMFLSSVPGYSSAGMPQAVKPIFELWTNKNFFSGNAIESARMERLSPQERFGAATTEAAKALSKALPMLSPVKIEHLATGYFGQLPLIIAAAADGLFRKEGAGVKPESRITEMPFVGQAFQKKFGGADTDIMYREATDAIQAKATYNKMRKEGRVEDAKEFLEDNRAEIASASMATNYQLQMGRLRADADRVTNNMPTLSAQEKRARLDKIEEARQVLSDRYRAAFKRVEQATDRTTPR
jgi:hypothetical protein